MSLRKYERNIARARMAAMGVEHVNEKMGNHLKKNKIRRLMQRGNGRKMLAGIRKEYVPVWRRVLYGDMAKDARRAQYAK